VSHAKCVPTLCIAISLYKQKLMDIGSNGGNKERQGCTRYPAKIAA
jgi:hypothetical protein